MRQNEIGTLITNEYLFQIIKTVTVFATSSFRELQKWFGISVLANVKDKM